MFLTLITSLLVGQAPESGIRAQFQTPSGNTVCLVFVSEKGSASLECELKENKAKKPPPPSDCDLDWGNRFSLSEKGKPVRVCYGDTLQGDYQKLEYGVPWKEAGFSCEVTQKRLRCTNSEGHGFELAKANQKLF